jgi:hypothetical protein
MKAPSEVPIKREYAELCAAVGVLHADMTSFEVFMTAGKIIRDRALCARRIELAKIEGTVILPDPLDVIEELSPNEIAQLRERVLAS